jgi:5,10-methylenetetrahydrofolate reductase
MFEIIPPPTNWGTEKVMAWVHEVGNIMQREEIYSLNLPEVIDEARNGKRHRPLISKLDNVRFASIMKREQPQLSSIPNKIIVRLPSQEFREWMDKSYKKGVHRVILVGGESQKINYPGLSVAAGAKCIKESFPDVEVGAITIFTRPHEAKRMIEKIKSGVDFFCSQIIFETANLKQVISELQSSCKAESLPFPKIFVSLSPASELKDIDFMKWLGVEFPSAIHTYLIQNETEVEARCFTILERVIEELFHFIEHSKIDLGFNVEHVRYTNLQQAAQLIKLIKQTSYSIAH